MSMQRTCAKCGDFFTPVLGGNYGFCPCCVVALRNDSADAARYQRRIAAGDINVRPLNKADAAKNRRAIRKRLNPETKDTNLKTWRDIK